MRIIAPAVLCFFAAVTAAQEMGTQQIHNYRKVDERHATGGQPTEEQLKAAAAEGFATVIPGVGRFHQADAVRHC